VRLATVSLQNFLADWNGSTPAAVADLYVFTFQTGEVFYYSGFQTPLIAPPPGGGNGSTSSATASGNVLHFSSIPSWIQVGQYVQDQTTPGAIPDNTTIISISTVGLTVTLSNNVTGGGVGSGDVIAFWGVFPLGPRFGRTKTKTQIGPQIDELEIDVYAGQDDTLGTNSGGTLTWQEALHYRFFDGAYCELQRAFITPPNTVIGTVTWFYGRVGDVQIGRTKNIIRVKSLLDLLTVQMPGRLFQAACGFKFGEPGVGMCGYDRVNGLNALGVSTGIGAVSITCQAGSTQNVIKTTFTPSPLSVYNNGTIIGTSGLNNGFSRTIGMLVNPDIFFLLPWIFPVVAGTDTFQLLPGCDHTFNTCQNTFQNNLRYGGMPYIPPPETAI
jgi:hypothetical protein